MTSARSRWVSIALASAWMGLSSGLALADVVDEKARAMTVEQVKSNYLMCSQRALCGDVSHGEIAICSILYEELKLRAFGGNFDKLLAWSRSPEHVQQRPGQRAGSCPDEQQAIGVRHRT